MSEKEGSGGQGMKKGPWTAAEDAILAEYVQKHGEGNWNSVQKNSGLMRCGKSCRLRWANHLRPNLKKGAFSPEEERTIIELHAKLGNKWARMAAQLPGRTDNEIKNYWNTRLKRRQRAGLPIYPQENIREEATPAFCHHVQQQQFHRDPFDQLLAGRKRPISCCSPPNSSLPPSQRQKTSGHTTYNFSPNNFTFDTYGNHHPIIPSYINNTNNNFNFQYCDKTNHTDKGRLVFPLSQVPSFSTALYGTNQNLDGQFSPPCDDGLSYSSLLMGGISLPHDSTNYCNDKDQRNGACLDEFLMGSQSLFGDAQSNTDMVNEKDRNVCPTGSKQGEAASEEMNSMDDDLSSLLTNFPSATPLPDWYTGNRIASAGGPFPDNPTQDSAIAVNTSSSHLASANWKNMPGIC